MSGSILIEWDGDGGFGVVRSRVLLSFSLLRFNPATSSSRTPNEL